MTNEDLLIWGFGLIGAAFALAILELLIPSGGIIAITASVVALAGVVAFWQVDWVWGVTSLVGSIVAGVAFIQFALKVMPYTPVGRGLILGGPDDEEEARRRAELDRARREAERALVGREGWAITSCRPVGSAEIDGQRYEVLAQGGSIESGESVRVVSVEGNQIKVRRLG